MFGVTPGMRTSEFRATVVGVVALIVSATQDYISNPTAAKLSLAGLVGYVISRGLAKYESRGTTPPTPPAPPAG